MPNTTALKSSRQAALRVGPDCHILGKRLVLLGVVDELRRRRCNREVLECHEREELVFVGLIVHATQRGEPIAFLSPREPLVHGRRGVERDHNARRHVAQQHAVSGLIGCVNNDGHPIALLVEREVAHIADVHFGARGQFIEEQFAAGWTIRGAAPPSPPAAAAAGGTAAAPGPVLSAPYRCSAIAVAFSPENA
jgi:hypothetical protein